VGTPEVNLPPIVILILSIHLFALVLVVKAEIPLTVNLVKVALMQALAVAMAVTAALKL
jgi:hypothetical protein